MEVNIDVNNESELDSAKHFRNPLVTKITYDRTSDLGTIHYVYTRMDVPQQDHQMCSPIDFKEQTVKCAAWGFYGVGTGQYNNMPVKRVQWIPTKRGW